MQTLRNALIGILSAAVLCSTLACALVYRAGFDFPEWMNLGAKRSYLEGRSYQKLPELSYESVSEGVFQDELEQYVSDLVPMRDGLLLANASLQRLSSEQMATALGFDAYPTFFGSKYYYLRSSDALYAFPVKKEEVKAKVLSGLADQISNLAQAHPDTRFVFYKAPRSCDIPYGPAFDLASDPLTDEWWDATFFDRMEGSVQKIETSIDTFDKYSAMYTRTDHHWGMDGAYQGYVDVATALGFGSELVEKGQRIEYDKPVFYGSLSRGGLFAGGMFDKVYDYAFDLPDYALYVDGKESSCEAVDHVEMYATGNWQKNLFANRYGEYFHGDSNTLDFVNRECDGGETLLIVGDSFTNAMERLFTSHYKRVYVIDARHSKQTVSEVMDQLGDVSDVVFMMSYNTIVNEDLKRTMN